MNFKKIFRSKFIQRPLLLIVILINNTRRSFARPIGLYFKYQELFRDKSALEIGGPTPLFGEDAKCFPIYSVLSRLDNCNFSDKTVWSSVKEGDPIECVGNRPGKQIVDDGCQLAKFKNSSYEIIINSHVVEHLANPIKALFRWKEVLTEGGILVMVIPHKDGTYDHRRPVTSMAHIIDDFNHNTPESDTTHFDEVLRLHDLKRDSTVSNSHEHLRRTNNNEIYRVVHHHVFDTLLVCTIVDYCGFEIVGVEQIRPYHIVLIARKSTGVKICNDSFLDRESKLYRKSPFQTDLGNSKCI
jgi:hypothetical protein